MIHNDEIRHAGGKGIAIKTCFPLLCTKNFIVR
jgi:hypothetical protein